MAPTTGTVRRTPWACVACCSCLAVAPASPSLQLPFLLALPPVHLQQPQPQPAAGETNEEAGAMWQPVESNSFDVFLLCVSLGSGPSR